MGVWGGYSFEGILEDDRFEPKRFFSFWEDRALLELVMTQFDLIYFRKVTVEAVRTYRFPVAHFAQGLNKGFRTQDNAVSIHINKMSWCPNNIAKGKGTFR